MFNCGRYEGHFMARMCRYGDPIKTTMQIWAHKGAVGGPSPQRKVHQESV